MPLFPESTNEAYRGAKASAVFLVIAGVLEIVPGCIHYFLPDGGAGVIAGLDLTQNGHVIVGTFAWMGSLQIPFGLAMVMVGWRYRPLVPMFLSLILLERFLMAMAGWVFKASPTGHHPPEHYASVIALPVIAVFLALALRTAESTGRDLLPPVSTGQGRGRGE